MTFYELSEKWLKSCKNNIKPGTYEHYCYVVRTLLQPDLGQIPVRKIRQEIIDDFFIKLQTTPRIRTNSILCSGLVHKSFMLLNAILKYGQKQNLCKKFTSVFPKVKNSGEIISKKKYFEAEEIQKIIQSCRSLLDTNRKYYALGILLALFQGLRIGEICGLKWEDIDFQHQKLTINRTVRLSVNPDTKKEEFIIGSPKSITSHRTIPINNFLFTILMTMKKNQTGYIIKNSDKISEENSVLPCSPRVLRNNYKKLLSASQLPQLTFHCLRHTFASTTIQHNIDPKTVSELLGHSDVKITLNLYVHASDQRKKECVNVISRLCNI